MGILLSCLVNDHDIEEPEDTDPGQTSAEGGQKSVKIQNLSGVNSVTELKKSRDAQNSMDEQNGDGDSVT
jgi:hypothetical protein